MSVFSPWNNSSTKGNVWVLLLVVYPNLLFPRPVVCFFPRLPSSTHSYADCWWTPKDYCRCRSEVYTCYVFANTRRNAITVKWVKRPLKHSTDYCVGDCYGRTLLNAGSKLVIKSPVTPWAWLNGTALIAAVHSVTAWPYRTFTPSQWCYLLLETCDGVLGIFKSTFFLEETTREKGFKTKLLNCI